MTDSSERLASVDVLKGMLIIAIVFVHIVIVRMDVLLSGADAAGTGVLSDDPASVGSLVIQALYLGLMAFFIISGYFYRPGRGFVENMKKRVLQLVVALTICAIMLPVITYAIMAVCGKAPGLEDLLTAFQWGFGLNGVFSSYDVFSVHPKCGGCIGYYYLWTMLWGFLIFYAIADRVREDWRKTVAAILVLLVITMLLKEFLPVKLPMYAQLGPIAAAFMLVGMAASKHGLIERVEGFRLTSGRDWALFLGSLVTVIVLVAIFPPGTDFPSMGFGDFGGYSVFIYFVEAMVMFVVLLHLALLFSRMIGFNWVFTTAGRHSLGILLLHGSLVTMMIAPFYDLPSGDWFPDEMGLTPSLIVAVLSIVLSIIICVEARKVLERMAERKAEGSAQ
jgi:fucose 4-O-acetylase-like acetyltransferase